MAVFKQREVDSTTKQVARVYQYGCSTDGYTSVRLLDINGNVIGKALMDFEADAPFYRPYHPYT